MSSDEALKNIRNKIVSDLEITSAPEHSRVVLTQIVKMYKFILEKDTPFFQANRVNIDIDGMNLLFSLNRVNFPYYINESIRFTP